MQLVTRLDLDGLVCGAMIYDKERIDTIRFATPRNVEERTANIQNGDCVVHLPYHPDAVLWFHHHDYERLQPQWMQRVHGKWGEADSTARLVYTHYHDKKPDDEKLAHYDPIVKEVDRIYSARLEEADIVDPKEWMLLYYALDPHLPQDIDFGIRVMNFIRIKKPIEEILAHEDVKRNVDLYFKNTAEYEKLIESHTKLQGDVIYTDFRDLEKAPIGNRFIGFMMYPEGKVQVRVDRIGTRGEKVKVSVSKSIVNRKLDTNIGHLMALFAGGGAEGAGSCELRTDTADSYIERIISFV